MLRALLIPFSVQRVSRQVLAAVWQAPLAGAGSGRQGALAETVAFKVMLRRGGKDDKTRSVQVSAAQSALVWPGMHALLRQCGAPQACASDSQT